MECYKNIVGPQVRRLRYQRGLKQKDLAARLERLGWPIDRAGVSKIEARLMKVSDFQQLYLARALRVGLLDLFPKIDAGETVAASLERMMKRKSRNCQVPV
jgi:transcriptional regulator with XRE-family HTH domain